MNVLIVDDTEWKLEEIRALVSSAFPEFNLLSSDSYQAAIPRILDDSPELILLDMSIPTYSDAHGSADRFRPFGGRDILWEMKRRKIESKVIIVTQFEYFPEDDNLTKRSDLMREISHLFRQWVVGDVVYGSLTSDWRADLIRLIKKAGARR
ncbi:response regulator transcription factor [soil metagenome]